MSLLEDKSTQNVFRAKIRQLVDEKEKLNKYYRYLLTKVDEEFSDLHVESMLIKKEIDSKDQQLIKWEKLLKRAKYTINPPMSDKGHIQYDLSTLKTVPIAELYNFDKLRTSYNRQYAICPLHNEKTPSFVIYKDSNSWACFGGCDVRGGDNIKFLQLLNNWSFQQACDFLSK